MKAKTELLLYQLMWIAEGATRPTLGNLSGGFVAWAYRSGLLRTIHRLEANKVVETEGRSLDRVVRLTEKGHRLAMGEREPQACWKQSWDGKWRMVMFDIPERERTLRDQLRRELIHRHFGCLQKSVWISPRPIDNLARFLRKSRSGLRSFTLMEASLLPGQTDREIADAAWGFKRINKRYADYLQALEKWSSPKCEMSLESILIEERKLWGDAVQTDPLLPECLLPQGYRGMEAYRKRRKIVRALVARHF